MLLLNMKINAVMNKCPREIHNAKMKNNGSSTTE